MREIAEIVVGGSRDRKGKESFQMTELRQTTFDAAAFLSTGGLGRRIVHLKSERVFFSQGDPADYALYLQKGRAKLTVVSQSGKEATIMLFAADNFIGEESIARRPAFDCRLPLP
jgi:CRP/FNR family transcriptional regulator, cyclic AMP receptor protein